MILRTPIFCALLFAAGVVGARLLPHRSGAEAPQPSRPVVISRHDTQPIPGMPTPSGLPGDLIHLSRIPDTRTLRAAWKTGDSEEEVALVKRWAELDPMDGLQFFLFDELNGAPRNTSHAFEIANAWTKRDPDAYLKFLSGLPAAVPYPLTNTLDTLVRKRMESAPEAFLNYWKTAPAHLQNASYRAFFQCLFHKDPARAVAEMQQVPESWRANIYHDASSTSDPGLVLRGLLTADGVSYNPTPVHYLMRSLAKKDVAAAREIVIGLPPGEARIQAATEVVAVMAAKDPEAALTWMETHAPTAENRQRVAQALLKTDPARALAMNTGDSLWKYSAALLEYAKDLASKDWGSAAALARSATPMMREKIIDGMAESLAFGAADPLPGLAKLSEILSGNSKGSFTLDGDAFENLAPQHAPAVAAWLARQPTEVQQALIPPLAYPLRSAGPATAANLLASLPVSEARTTELINLTSNWADDAPQAAAGFSLTLPPGKDRDYAILNTAIAWHRNDPAAARAWVDALPASPAKTKTLAEISPP
jgi:hypothetical protein